MNQIMGLIQNSWNVTECKRKPQEGHKIQLLKCNKNNNEGTSQNRKNQYINKHNKNN